MGSRFQLHRYFWDAWYNSVANRDTSRGSNFNDQSFILGSGARKKLRLFRDFFAILGKGPKAFQIGKIRAINP